MPEFKLKSGETVSGTVEAEDEHHIYLINVTKKNLDGSVTSYYRYWIRKEDLAVEEKPKEEEKEEPKKVVEKVEKPRKRARRRRRK